MNISVRNINSGLTIIHVVGILGSDYSLCGHDTAGDESGGWEGGERTMEPANCSECKRLINYCKSIKAKSISKDTVEMDDWGSGEEYMSAETS